MSESQLYCTAISGGRCPTPRLCLDGGCRLGMVVVKPLQGIAEEVADPDIATDVAWWQSELNGAVEEIRRLRADRDFERLRADDNADRIGVLEDYIAELESRRPPRWRRLLRRGW